MISIYKKRGAKVIWMLIWILICFTKVAGQDFHIVKGAIIDGENSQAISYATVALYALDDSTLITGTLSHDDGSFELQFEQSVPCILKINYVGYKPWSLVIRQDDSVNWDALTVYMQSATIELDEAVVVSERAKAEKSFDKTTFFTNKKMLDASNTGIDILKYIPGVQVDWMQNVKLEGSSNILILVDGKEHDKNFLLQLNAKQIDKIEIINTPGANFDGSATGVINIVSKKNKNTGVSGNIVLDIPLRKSELYLFPLMNLSLGLKKINLYGAYNGDIRYFDLIENSTLSHFAGNQLTRELATWQYLRQQNWEHNFSYGFDYFMNENNIFNFYASHRVYSNETDGQVIQFDNDNVYWSADREEIDMNHSGYYSMYYKHLFGKEGHEISMDINYYHYKRENRVQYQNNQVNDSIRDDALNTLAPKQHSYGFKIDYTTPIWENLKIDAGLKLGLITMDDRLAENFNYHDHLISVYGTITYSKAKTTGHTGLRVERSLSGIDGSFDHNRFEWLPNAVINYQLSQKQNLKLSYSRRITRPYIYQLNPTVYVDDPFSLHSGNEHLIPELHDNLALDYSVLLGRNYLSSQLFYKTLRNSISNLSFLNDTAILESRFNNLGAISTYGIQFTTALKLSPTIDVNGFFKFFGENTAPNDLANEYHVESQENTGFEFGVSSAFSFKYDITASIAMQYSSPRIAIQNKTYNDLIYFISVDKAIKKNFKFGISLAPLFVKKFTYRGLETAGMGFKLESTGNIQLPNVPIGFKISYQLTSGEKNKKIERTKDIIDNKVKTGM